MPSGPPTDHPLGRLARWVVHRPRAVLLGGLIALAASLLLALPPSVNPNMLDLMPEHLPAVQALRALGDDHVPAGLWLSFSGEDPAQVERALEGFAERLEARADVAWTLHRLDPELALHAGLMQLDPALVKDMTARVQLALKLGPALSPLLAAKLLTLSEPVAELDASNPLLPGAERLFVKPTHPHHDPAFSEQLVSSVQQLADTELPEGVALDWVAGPYAVVADGTRGIREDLAITSALSATLVLLVLGGGLRSPKAPLLLFPPLLLAAVLQLALMQIVIGALNTYTVMGTAVLFGLGVDFSIHLVGRTREQLAEGVLLADAVALAWDRTGPACLFAALTSAAGFSALGLARFDGLSQLGFALTAGVLLALGSVLVFLPALIALLEPGGGTPMALDRVPSPGRAPRGAVVLLLLATLGVGAWSVGAVHFDHDFTTLGRDTRRFHRLTPEQRELTRQATPPALLPVALDDRAEAQKQLRERIADGDLPHVSAVISVDDVLPPDQPARVAQLARLRGLLDDPSLHYLPPSLVERLLPLREWTPRVWAPEDLPPSVRGLLGDGELLILPLTGELHDMRESGELLDELQQHAPDAASEIAVQGALFRIVSRDMPRLSLGALLLVALLTALDLRRPRQVVVALTSLITGLIWALAVVAALGIPLTLANLVGLPVLLGLGVDVVLHLAHRLREGSELPEALRTVGPAAALSTATTAASFSALWFAGNGGLRSLGQLVTVGLITVTLVSAGTLGLLWGRGTPRVPP